MAAVRSLKYASLTNLRIRVANLEIDGSLVDRVRVGDEDALESLYRRYSSLLYSVALRIVGDTAAAEEILQDTFFQLWRSAGKFDSARGSLTGWLLVITRSRALSRLRTVHAARFGSEDEALLVADLVPRHWRSRLPASWLCPHCRGCRKPSKRRLLLRISTD